MVCRKCHKKIRNGTPVCPYCGAPQNEVVSLGEMSNAPKTRKKKKGKGKKIAIILTTLLLVPALILGAVVGGGYLWLNQSPGDSEDLSVVPPEDLGINTELPPEEDVINIALFGLDNRSDRDDGRSDAIIVLSIDKKHEKIKMISLARDTLVNVEGYGWNDNSRDDDWTKLTHAFYYGSTSKSQIENNGGKNAGPKVAVKTINENFGLNITRYAYVNWYDFADIIDWLGGVEIDVKSFELAYLNKHIESMNRTTSMSISRIPGPGLQTLSGGQALAYSRLRHVDGDNFRTIRQKTVLQAAFNKAKKQNLFKNLQLISKVMDACHTNMTYADCISLATWAMNSSPEIVSISLPDDKGKVYSWSGSTGANRWGWVYILDLDYVSAYLQDIIYEEEPKKAIEENAQILTEPRFPSPKKEETTDTTKATDPTGQ